MEPVKVLQISDLHYSKETLDQIDRCFEYALNQARQAAVDLIVITGDATDYRLEINAPSFIRLAQRIREATDIAPVIMLQGTYSHEPPGSLNVFRYFGGKYPIKVIDTWCRIGLVGTELVTTDPYSPVARSRLDIWALPVLNKAAVVGLAGGLEGDVAYTTAISALLRSIRDRTRQSAQNGIPSLLISHGTIVGSTTETGMSLSGLDHEFTLDALFGAGTDVVALGHIHLHQSWQRENQKIAYAGSACTLHAGDVGEKYCLLWTLLPGQPGLQTITLPARKVYNFRFDETPDCHAIAAITDFEPDSIIRVSWKAGSAEQARSTEAQLRELLANRCTLKLEPIVEQKSVKRAGGISTLPTNTARLAAWAELHEKDAAKMIENFNLLQSQEANDIAEQICNRIFSPLPGLKVYEADSIETVSP
jgi:exonuclease SbcD